MSTQFEKITVGVLVNAPVEHAWKIWTTPEDIVQWNFASADWCCPAATNNLKVGGLFSYRMEAKDNSFGFDFSGKYTEVEEHKIIEYLMDDGRSSRIHFKGIGHEQTSVTQTFDPESTNPIEMQKNGWQAIMDNYKRKVEL